MARKILPKGNMVIYIVHKNMVTQIVSMYTKNMKIIIQSSTLTHPYHVPVLDLDYTGLIDKAKKDGKSKNIL